MIQLNPTGSWLLSSTAAALFAVSAALIGSHSVCAQSLIYGIGGTDTGAGPNAAAYTLFDFSSATPGTTTSLGTVTPTTGYVLESIAFQPTTGNLYGFQYNGSTNQGQVVTINKSTGALATVGTAFTIGSISGSAGNSATISFTPSGGVLQLVTGTYGNYRINPATGAQLGQDASVGYVAGDPNVNNTFQISSLAFNSSGTLYDIDYINGSLATQNTTSAAGQLTTVGFLGVTPTQGAPSTGFTIAGTTGFLNSTVATQGGAVRDNLYSVNLATGAATSLGSIGGSTTFNTVDLAAFVVPEPGTSALLLAGGLGIAILKYRRHRRAA